MPRALIVEILGDAKQFGAELDKAAGKTRQFSKAAGVAGLAIAGGLAYGLEKSVKAAMEAQTTTARLDQAFKQSGESAKKYAGQIDQAESSGRKLGFTNDDVRQSLGSLEVATHSHTQAIKDLGIAQDIARFKHVGLSDASKVLTMAMAGSQRAIKQLGLTLAPVTTAEDKVKAAFKDHSSAAYQAALATAKLEDKQKTAAGVISLVHQKTKDQAKAFADTAAGGMAQFHAQTQALEEGIGKGLLPIIGKLVGKLADMAGWLSKHTTVAKILIGVLAGIAGALIIVSAATFAWGVVTAAAFLPITAVIAALVLLGVGIYEIVKHWGAITAFFGGVWDAIKGAFMTGVDFVKNLLTTAWDAIKGAATTAWNAVVGVIKGAWDLIKGVFDILKSAAEREWDGLKAIWHAVWNAITGVFDTIKDDIMRPFNWVKGKLEGLWGDLKSAWASDWSVLKNLVMGPINAIIGLVKTAIGWIKDLINLIPSIHSPSGGPSSKGGTLPGQPRGPKGGRGASGAIVRSPTFALIGEAGPEAVVPLNRMPGASPLGAGGGAPVINVTVNGWVGDNAALANKIRNELVALGRVEARSIFAGYA